VAIFIRFIAGDGRYHRVLLPPRIEDHVSADAAARVIDAFFSTGSSRFDRPSRL
jgi:hypothetical protein